MKRALSILVLLAVLLGGSLTLAPVARPAGLRRWAEDAMASHRHALWHLVHEVCVVNRKTTGAPAPCSAVNLVAGYAVLKDIQGPTQYLVIPTAPVSGIESPSLLMASSPNYWLDAWRARRWLVLRVGHPVPRWGVGLAVNSQPGRSQDQLHIHLDCVRADVNQVLARREATIGEQWSTLRIGPGGFRYRVRWVDAADLSSSNLFALVADGDRLARADMGQETMALIGAQRPDGAPGFFLLADHADPDNGDFAGAEELLDHSCAQFRRAG